MQALCKDDPKLCTVILANRTESSRWQQLAAMLSKLPRSESGFGFPLESSCQFRVLWLLSSAGNNPGFRKTRVHDHHLLPWMLPVRRPKLS